MYKKRQFYLSAVVIGTAECTQRTQYPECTSTEGFVLPVLLENFSMAGKLATNASLVAQHSVV